MTSKKTTALEPRPYLAEDCAPVGLRYIGPSGVVLVNGRTLQQGDVVDGPPDVLAEMALRSDFEPATAKED